jgi:hypothetical protein
MARRAKETQLEHLKRMLRAAEGFQPDFLSPLFLTVSYWRTGIRRSEDATDHFDAVSRVQGDI